MVNYEAIAATSATLKNLLMSHMKSKGVEITINRPVEIGSNNRINLFLFQVTENKHLKSTNDSRLWLDLYYLLTPFGYKQTNEGSIPDETQTHVILGDAMRVFHDYPIIHPDLKLKLNDDEVQILEDVLKDAVEQIKITPYPMTLEELSKIWTPIKGDFRLSVAYQVSVVQIGSKKEKLYPAPVRARHIDVFPFEHPEITEILPQGVCIGESITIHGRNFYSKNTIVKISGKPSEPLKPKNLTDDKIIVEIPSDILPGPHLVEVVLEPLPKKKFGISSNQGVFILCPMIRNITTIGDPRNEMVIITGTKLYDPGPPELKPILLIGDQSVELDELSPTKVKIKGNKLKEIEDKLPDNRSPIRISVNNVESRGLPCEDGKNEWMWLYDKTRASVKNKIIKKRFPKKVNGI